MINIYYFFIRLYPVLEIRKNEKHIFFFFCKSTYLGKFQHWIYSFLHKYKIFFSLRKKSIHVFGKSSWHILSEIHHPILLHNFWPTKKIGDDSNEKLTQQKKYLILPAFYSPASPLSSSPNVTSILKICHVSTPFKGILIKAQFFFLTMPSGQKPSKY